MLRQRPAVGSNRTHGVQADSEPILGRVVSALGNARQCGIGNLRRCGGGGGDRRGPHVIAQRVPEGQVDWRLLQSAGWSHCDAQHVVDLY